MEGRAPQEAISSWSLNSVASQPGLRPQRAESLLGSRVGTDLLTRLEVDELYSPASQRRGAVY